MSNNLQSCPDCGKEISKRAAACPHCGAPLAGTPVAPVVVARSGVGDGARIGIGLLAVALVAGALLYASNQMDSDERAVMLVVAFLIFVVGFFGLVRKGKKAMERDRASSQPANR